LSQHARSAVKLSQSFLANAQDSLPRWAAHARLERLRGRPAPARKVYETVLSADFSAANRLGAGPLWWDWAEMEWLTGDARAAERVVLRAAGVAGGGGGGGVMLLRARHALDETARGIPGVLWKVREAWVRLGALLELLGGGAQLPAFMAEPAHGQDGGPEDESRTVAALAMLYHVAVTLRGAGTGVVRPADVRARLERALSAFPNNTVLLGMYLEMQKGQGVWGRVRELVGGEGHERGVARRVADVWMAGWEAGRWAWELERTRAGLEAAVKCERCVARSVLVAVWRTC
jgi:hypothetical protein